MQRKALFESRDGPDQSAALLDSEARCLLLLGVSPWVDFPESTLPVDELQKGIPTCDLVLHDECENECSRMSEQFSVSELLLYRNVQRFRGGLVFKAHRRCVSLNSRLERNKEEAET